VTRLVELVAEDEDYRQERQRRPSSARCSTTTRTRTASSKPRDLGKTSGDEIAAAVTDAIDENPDAVEDYHDGDDGAINFLVGQVMQKTGGSADPGDVNGLLRAELEE